jgi:3-methyladenine DNA glycosylase AlkC
VVRGLNDGTLEAATLAEGLVVDFSALLRAVAPELPAALRDTVRPDDGITARMRAAGEALFAHYGLDGLPRFAGHSSDTVRGWGAYLVAAAPGLTLARRLKHVRPLADDPHFGVREWAWLAVRGAVAAEVVTAVRLLTPWATNPSANVRRFASEVTRPRGVWCPHIERLKAEPDLGLPLLEPLRSDPSKYVRDSVANWLNDAGKTRPEWVRQVCSRWQQESPTPETRHLATRATRNL